MTADSPRSMAPVARIDRPRTSAGRGASRRPESRAGRRVLRRRRLAGFLRLAVFLLLIFIAVWAGVRVAHAGGDAAVYRGEKYVVGSGETLWGIAIHHYGDDTDPRRGVYDIRRANGLAADSVLQPGDTLMLPYAGE